MLRLFLAVLHLLALGIGLGAVWARARTLAPLARLESSGVEGDALRATLARAFTADAWWGIAAVLWISTGLWRLLAGTEKATSYYLGNHVFLAKMGMLLAVFALEVWPAVTLVRWRRDVGRGVVIVPAGAARRIVGISYVQVGLVVVMVGMAVAMARGWGAR